MRTVYVATAFTGFEAENEFCSVACRVYWWCVNGEKATVGMDGAYPNRHDRPYGGWPQQPTGEVETADELAQSLL